MRASDQFRVGNTTKTFASAVVLQLAGEGKLALDDSVERWLPGLVPNGGAITVRHLLNHTSGLPTTRPARTRRSSVASSPIAARRGSRVSSSRSARRTRRLTRARSGRTRTRATS
jgi:CubicO group peptidase (beta-lactamase class C family)